MAVATIGPQKIRSCECGSSLRWLLYVNEGLALRVEGQPDDDLVAYVI